MAHETIPGLRALNQDWNAMATANPDIIRLLLASQEQIRTELGKLSRSAAAQEARTTAMAENVTELKSAIGRIHQYTVTCPARSGWRDLKEDISEIRIMAMSHEREIAEGSGYRKAKTSNGPSKKQTSLTSFGPPLSISFAFRDPKFWGKVVFYSLLAAAASFSVAMNM